MRAGLKANIHSTQGNQVLICRCDAIETVYFCMRLSVTLVPAFANNAALIYKHRPNHGIGSRITFGKLRELKTTLYVNLVIDKPEKMNG